MQKKKVFLLQATKEQNQELKARFLDLAQFEVVGESFEGISAIPAIEEKKPNFLITDLVLAGYDGISVISKVKEMNIPIKIVVISALMSEEIVSKAMSAGADYFMAKPYNFSILIDRMESLVGKGERSIKEIEKNSESDING